ncbi:MAG: D-tyrosyl-tRNA(Tyr) deacylase [Clostridiales bacterium]|nr:D-tyrosyl-tRNA(Tyr) deacylase [Clostridiales bacterium]
MRFVIQVVDNASVRVDGAVTGSCGKGFLVLIGVCDTDTVAIADKMCDKMLAMRILPDENGKTNLSLKDVDGSLLLVSQFTLYADCKKGNRPSFVKAGAPDLANSLYEHIIARCKEFLGDDKVGTGVFGADMKVSLVNSGPFTIVLDSAELGC